MQRGNRCVSPRLNYVVTAGDTVEGLQKRFQAKTDELWDSLKHETFLLEQGSRIAFGEGSFTAGNLTLKEAAAVLFVRFYEESAPEDMIYAGDIVRQNEGLDMNWEETEPGKRSLMLPGWEKEYHTLRGDTPQRLGKFVSLLDAEMGSLPEWKAFYEDICRRNQEGKEKISRILFCIPWITVCRDLDLGGLSARIYPDYREEEAPTDKLFGAKILKANTPVIIPNAVYTVSDGEPVTPALVMNAMPCTWEELGQAVREDSVFKPGQEIYAAGVNTVKKTEILRRLQKEADSVGAALSRFLLQGLKILDPLRERRKSCTALSGAAAAVPYGDGEYGYGFGRIITGAGLRLGAKRRKKGQNGLGKNCLGAARDRFYSSA